MASIINASTSGVGGVITTADNSGDLNIQSGGSTKIAVTSAGVAVTGTLSATSYTGALTGATGLPKAALPTGSVLQVVNATYGTTVGTSSTSFSDTGLTATITPTSATSKILVLVSVSDIGKENGNSGSAALLKLFRSSSEILNLGYYIGFTLTDTRNYIGSVSATYLDSPATTSATTYKTQFASLVSGQTVYINASQGKSTITLMEIAA
jgi:hypothetical protein